MVNLVSNILMVEPRIEYTNGEPRIEYTNVEPRIEYTDVN